MIEVTISNLEAGQRLDKFLKKYFDRAPASLIYRLLRKKAFRLNGVHPKGSEQICAGDLLRIYLPEEQIRDLRSAPEERTFSPEDLAEAERFERRILFENEDLLVFNKPAGLLTQRAERSETTCTELLRTYLLCRKRLSAEELRTFHPSPLNRLDRNTSGIVLCGVSLKGSQEGSQLLRSREIGKFYHAIVWGRTPDTVDERAWFRKETVKNRAEFFRGPGEGRSEVHTAFRTLRRSGGYSLLEVDLLTGKTHQIRAHLAYLGWPVLGDPKYGPRKKNDAVSAKRQMLHAIRLEFPEDHVPSGLADGSVTAPYPEDFRKALRETGLD